MSITARLKDIAEEIGMQSDEHTAYFDQNTGKLVMVSDDDFRDAEENRPIEELPDWRHEIIELAKLIANDAENRYLALPSQWDFNEYKVMERFCWSLDDQEISDELLDAIRGRGAFRMFKDRIHRLEIQNDWYQFRDDALKELASDWAEENNIELIDG